MCNWGVPNKSYEILSPSISSSHLNCFDIHSISIPILCSSDDEHIGQCFGLSQSQVSELIKDIVSHVWANSAWLQASRDLSDQT